MVTSGHSMMDVASAMMGIRQQKREERQKEGEKDERRGGVETTKEESIVHLLILCFSL